ncbi:hypothetical protein MNBD_GAMMA12-538 [hydrothermal vent metagenome]|uniref:Uncharacterized protein n=1 Tax=hydrothermal vent metagenome TaxID=652676 RepID=A0A3B0Y9W2_9ZZZZ
MSDQINQKDIKTTAGTDSKTNTKVVSDSTKKVTDIGNKSASIPVSYLIFVLLLGVAGFCFVLWNKIQDVQLEQQQILIKAREQVSNVELKLDQREVTFKQYRLSSEQQLKSLREAVIQLRSVAGRGKTGWVLSEVEYLLLIANHQLRLSGNIKTAIQALTEADERLHSLGDPRSLTTRKLIAVEIQSLKKVKVPDISGMTLKLDSLTEPVLSMALATASVETLRGNVKKDKVPKSKEKGLAKSLENALNKLKGLVVVRRLSQPIKPMLKPEQEAAIRQVLELKLQAARVALVLGKQQRFHSSLVASISWIKSNFDTSNKVVQQVLLVIGQLADAKLKPILPDISSSLREVRLLLQQTGKPSTSSESVK